MCKTPISYLYNSSTTTEKDIEKAFLPNKFTEIYTEERPP